MSPESCELRVGARSDLRRSSLEPKLNAGLEAEVALAVVAAGEVVAEAGQHIIRIHDSDRDFFAGRKVDAAAHRHRKGVIAGRLASADARFGARISVKVGMRPAKQHFSKRLHLAPACL